MPVTNLKADAGQRVDRLVATLDGVGHLPRESAGECHLTVCGRFVRGPLLPVEPGRGRARCRACWERYHNPWVGGDTEQPPAAVRMGRGTTYDRAGPARKGRLSSS